MKGMKLRCFFAGSGIAWWRSRRKAAMRGHQRYAGELKDAPEIMQFASQLFSEVLNPA